MCGEVYIGNLVLSVKSWNATVLVEQIASHLGKCQTLQLAELAIANSRVPQL